MFNVIENLKRSDFAQIISILNNLYCRFIKKIKFQKFPLHLGEYKNALKLLSGQDLNIFTVG